MSTDLGASFNEQFMKISTKLKKRFMRKPNLAEASNEFIALAIQCENSEQPAFAGHAYVGAARCEAMAGNGLGEADHYVSAARQFIKAEKKIKTLKFISPDRENLEAAIGCFLQALNKYPDRSPIHNSVLLEMADSLVMLRHKHEAFAYYELAMDAIEDVDRKLMFLRTMVRLLIDTEKFDIALEIANVICDSYKNIPDDMLAEIQVSRVLLNLLLEPAYENKPNSVKQLFTDLQNNTQSKAMPFNVGMILKLQSIIMSCIAGDVSTLISIGVDIKPYLTTHQINLLDALIKEKKKQNLSQA